MDKKLFGQELKYLGKINFKLVKWKGFDYDQCTWEPLRNL